MANHPYDQRFAIALRCRLGFVSLTDRNQKLVRLPLISDQTLREKINELSAD